MARSWTWNKNNNRYVNISVHADKLVPPLFQGFLTAVRQEIARANRYALDVAALNNEVTRMSQEEISRAPSEGKIVF